jgi:hypothetical protein
VVTLVRFRPVDGAFEPALVVFSVVVALGVAYVIWEVWFRGK